MKKVIAACFTTALLGISSLGFSAPANLVGHYIGTGTYGSMNHDTGKFGKEVMPLELKVYDNNDIEISHNNSNFYLISGNTIGKKYITIGYAISASNIVTHKAKLNGKGTKMQGLMTHKVPGHWLEFKYKLTKM